MPDVTRKGTDYNGGSDPGRAVLPANDYLGRNITMAVAVQKGQVVAEDANSKGVLADASAGENQKVVGIATEKVQAGQRVHCLRWGLMSGFDFTGGSPGDLIYLSTTAGELSDTPGDVPVVLGSRHMNAEIFFDIGMGIGLAAQAAAVADLAASTNITAVPGTFADLAAVQTYLAAAIPIIEARLDANEAKINAMLASLRAAGVMAT